MKCGLENRNVSSTIQRTFDLNFTFEPLQFKHHRVKRKKGLAISNVRS